MAKEDHWFVPKPVGYGATPANAKGWAAVLVCLAAIVVLAVICFVIMTPSPASVIVFVVGTLIEMAALVIVAKAKTKGEWRWRSRKSNA